MSVLDIFATLKLNSDEYESGLKEASSRASGFADKLKSGFNAAAGASAAAFGVAIAGVAKFATDATNSYASFEQLIGGVQKLYGTAGMSVEEYAEKNGATVNEIMGKWQSLEAAQQAVLKNAEAAFLTSGKNVNEYMETATSFSASLIKSLNGDTQRAAEITDVAMRAISDNVNTFGGNAENVQNAIMGLSRNNFTMLDNLRLGYAGTAQGMLELINDSGVLNERLTDTKQLASVGFDQMILAIQAVQEQQGIAGTTAREALHTIEGSATATKKAWDNVVTAVGRGEGLEQALNGLVTSLFGDASGGGLVNNIIPRIEMVMNGISELIVRSAPLLASKLPELTQSILPALLATATQVVGGFAKSLPGIAATILPIIAGSVTDIATQAYGYLSESFPRMMSAGTELVASLSEGLKTAIPEFIGNALPMLLGFSAGLRENFGALVDSGIGLVMAIVDGLIAGLPALIEYVPQIVSNIAGIINDNAPKLLAAGLDIVAKIGLGIIQSIPVIIENAGSIAMSVFDVVSAFNWLDLGGKAITAIGDGMASLISHPINAASGIVDGIKGIFQGFDWHGIGSWLLGRIAAGIESLWSRPAQIFKMIVSAMSLEFTGFEWHGLAEHAVNTIANGISSLASRVVGAFRNMLSQAANAIRAFDWLGTGKAIIDGIVSGITRFGGNVLGSLRNVASNALSGVKGFLGIASPSRKMRDEIGQYIPLGLAEGINDKAKYVYDAMTDLSRGTEDAYSPNVGGTGFEANQGGVIGAIKSLESSILGMQVVLDSGSLVGGISEQMDESLGSRSIYSRRGI